MKKQELPEKHGLNGRLHSSTKAHEITNLPLSAAFAKRGQQNRPPFWFREATLPFSLPLSQRCRRFSSVSGGEREGEEGWRLREEAERDNHREKRILDLLVFDFVKCVLWGVLWVLGSSSLFSLFFWESQNSLLLVDSFSNLQRNTHSLRWEREGERAYGQWGHGPQLRHYYFLWPSTVSPTTWVTLLSIWLVVRTLSPPLYTDSLPRHASEPLTLSLQWTQVPIIAAVIKRPWICSFESREATIDGLHKLVSVKFQGKKSH